MAILVYSLCALTSTSCAFALVQQYRRTRVALLFWSCLGFFGLAMNSIFVFIDYVLLPQADLAIVRVVPALLGVGALVWGFIEEGT